MKEFVYKFADDEIELTVLLPLFRGKFIGWVAFESLLRQSGRIPPWELIVAEEQDDEEMGFDNILTYVKEGLKEKGCVKFRYIKLEKWIPLADKFSLMIKRSDENSIACVFQAADYYSNPFRLEETYKAFLDPNVMWLVPPKQYVFNVSTPDRIMLVDKTRSKRKDDTSGKSVRAWLAQRVSHYMKGVDRGVDGYFHELCEYILGYPVPFTVLESDSWKANLVVNGFGTLSAGRAARMFKDIRRWGDHQSIFSGSLFQIVPDDIGKSLIASREYIQKHNRKRGDLG